MVQRRRHFSEVVGKIVKPMIVKPRSNYILKFFTRIEMGSMSIFDELVGGVRFDHDFEGKKKGGNKEDKLRDEGKP